MKKIFATILVTLSVSVSMNAQIVRQNLLDGYVSADMLEKNIYTAKDTPIAQYIWSAGYTSKPIEGAVSPVVAEGLTFEGYNEGGQSILLGSSFNGEVKGRRMSVYSLTDSSKELKQGLLYMSFLVNFDKIGTKSMSDLIGFCSSYVGGGHRGTVCVKRDDQIKNKYYFGVKLIDEVVGCSTAFEMGKTYLVVLKIDYTKSLASLHVNPDLSATEPQPLVEVNAGDSTLKHAIRSIMIRDYYGYEGRIGNIRIARNWESLGE